MTTITVRHVIIVYLMLLLAITFSAIIIHVGVH